MITKSITFQICNSFCTGAKLIMAHNNNAFNIKVKLCNRLLCSIVKNVAWTRTAHCQQIRVFLTNSVNTLWFYPKLPVALSAE